jgi:hypothetical protein
VFLEAALVSVGAGSAGAAVRQLGTLPRAKAVVEHVALARNGVARVLADGSGTTVSTLEPASGRWRTSVLAKPPEGHHASIAMSETGASVVGWESVPVHGPGLGVQLRVATSTTGSAYRVLPHAIPATGLKTPPGGPVVVGDRFGDAIVCDGSRDGGLVVLSRSAKHPTLAGPARLPGPVGTPDAQLTLAETGTAVTAWTVNTKPMPEVGGPSDLRVAVGSARSGFDPPRVVARDVTTWLLAGND